MKRCPTGRRPHLPPTILRRLYPPLAPHACFCHRFPCRCAPPFSAFGLHLGTCRPLRGSAVVGPSTSLCPCLPLPEFSSGSWHHHVLGIVVGWILTKRREARAPPLLGSRTPWYLPPSLLGNTITVQATLTPPHNPPPSSPLSLPPCSTH